jgi:PAS domain S-box-containing protein
MNPAARSTTAAEGSMKDQAGKAERSDVPIEFVAESFHRQCEILYRLTAEMLASKHLDEKLSLVLHAVTSEFGYSHAAVAFPDGDSDELQIRLALGFPDDKRVIGAAVPKASNDSGCSPFWIRRQNSEAESRFLERIDSSTDLLALPLLGRNPRETEEIGSGRRPFRDTDVFVNHAGSIGMLYIAWAFDDVRPSELNLLVRLADRVGLTIAMAEQNERLTTKIARLEGEREWVNAISHSVADPIVLTNLDNHILLQNRRAEELFSESGKKHTSERTLNALKMNDLLLSAYLSNLSLSGTAVAGRELTLVDPSKGSDTHFEVVSTAAYDSIGKRIGIVSVFRDVTELRQANEEMIRNVVKLQQAEAEVRTERDRLNLIIENVGHPVVVGDANGSPLLFNRRAETFFEQSGSPSPASAAAVRTNAIKLMSFVTTLASTPGTERHGEIELTDPETGNILPMDITSVEIIGTSGEVNAIVSILHDLSGIRELERRRVQQQLFESEKLAAIGRLTASIAHEINNPLEAIKNSLYLLQTSESDASKRFLEIALKETERVSQIIAQMLGFTRGTGTMESVDINDLLDETLVLLDTRLKQSGTCVVRQFQKDLPKIPARPNQLRQVFLNLLLNASQSIRGRGTITVMTSQLSGSAERWISLEISDTGVGISDEDLTRIFEPFFSTRKKGTGLGLWVTQDLVRHHGGRIEVTSVLGRGTTFRIVLPIEPPPGQAMKDSRAALNA